jgi:hypothetical protein
VKRANALIIGAAIIEAVDLLVKGAHGFEVLGNSQDQLDRQNPHELHPQLVAAHSELLGLGLPGRDVLLVAGLGVAHAQSGQRPPPRRRGLRSGRRRWSAWVRPARKNAPAVRRRGRAGHPTAAAGRPQAAAGHLDGVCRSLTFDGCARWGDGGDWASALARWRGEPLLLCASGANPFAQLFRFAARLDRQTAVYATGAA